MDTFEPSKSVMCVPMVQENDPYAVPVTSMVRHNQLPPRYANESFSTRLTARVGRGISGPGTSHSRTDASKVGVQVSGPDSATGPSGRSVGRGAEFSGDSDSRGIHVTPSATGSADLPPERVPNIALPASRPPLTPAGRLVLNRLPGRFPPVDGPSPSAAQDRITPPGRDSSMFLRIGAWFGRSFPRVAAALVATGPAAPSWHTVGERRDAWPADAPSEDEVPRRSDVLGSGWAA